jgi:hypothetical protein
MCALGSHSSVDDQVRPIQMEKGDLCMCALVGSHSSVGDQVRPIQMEKGDFSVLTIVKNGFKTRAASH